MIVTPASLPSSRTNAFVNDKEIQTRQRTEIHAVGGPNAVRTDFSIYRVRMRVNPMFWDRPRGELHRGLYPHETANLILALANKKRLGISTEDFRATMRVWTDRGPWSDPMHVFQRLSEKFKGFRAVYKKIQSAAGREILVVHVEGMTATIQTIYGFSQYHLDVTDTEVCMLDITLCGHSQYHMRRAVADCRQELPEWSYLVASVLFDLARLSHIPFEGNGKEPNPKMGAQEYLDYTFGTIDEQHVDWSLINFITGAETSSLLMDLLAAVPAGTNAKKDPVFVCFEHCRLAGKLTPFLAYALRLAKDKESHERRKQIAHSVCEIHITVDRNNTRCGRGTSPRFTPDSPAFETLYPWSADMVGNIPSQVPRGEMLMGSVLFLQRARGLPYNNNDAYVRITTKIDAPIKDDPAQSVVTASRLVIYSMMQQHLLYSLVIDGPDKPNQPRCLDPNIPIDVPKPYAVSSADLASAFAMIFCPTSMLYFWNPEVTLESVCLAVSSIQAVDLARSRAVWKACEMFAEKYDLDYHLVMRPISPSQKLSCFCQDPRSASAL